MSRASAGASSEARAVIDALSLQPHPEGGWYRETWRPPAMLGERPTATAIYFLLDGDERSRWHRIDAAEMWLWHAGHPITLSVAASSEATATEYRLGSCIVTGERPQFLIQASAWQAAHAAEGWALVSCVVSPGFEFASFELAPENWSPRGGRVDEIQPGD